MKRASSSSNNSNKQQNERIKNHDKYKLFHLLIWSGLYVWLNMVCTIFNVPFSHRLQNVYTHTRRLIDPFISTCQRKILITNNSISYHSPCLYLPLCLNEYMSVCVCIENNSTPTTEKKLGRIFILLAMARSINILLVVL